MCESTFAQHGRADMPTAYCAADGIGRYLQETFSQSQIAYDSSFVFTERRIRQTGSFGCQQICLEEGEMTALRGFGEAVLKVLADKYSTSTFQSGHAIWASQTVICQVVYTQQLQANHQKCSGNWPSGIPKGTRFQRVILQCFVEKHRVFSIVLYTEGASVSLGE
jgi:hypothetical protein